MPTLEVRLLASRSAMRTTLAHVSATLVAFLALASCGGSAPPPRPQRTSRDAPTARTRHRRPPDVVRRLIALGMPVYCGGRHGHDVAFTFDDGPGPYTHLALRKLRRTHERATFFDVGRSIQRFPGYLRPELRLGAIGDHTQDHLPLTELPPAAIRHELAVAARAIRAGSGRPVDLWRPPYELHDATTDRIAHRLGLLEILWNVDSRDSLGAGHAQIVANVAAGLRPGAIVEMHENRGQTIRALSTLLPLLHRRHLRSVGIPQLLRDDPPSLAQLRAGPAGCAVSRRARGQRHRARGGRRSRHRRGIARARGRSGRRPTGVARPTGGRSRPPSAGRAQPPASCRRARGSCGA